jgi:STAS domain-containing protein
MMIIVDVSAIAAPDCGTVDALARIQLGAQRIGHRVVLRGATPELLELVDLAGLGDVLPTEPGSGVEVPREAEKREEARGVQEEGDPADPAVRQLEHLE